MTRYIYLAGYKAHIWHRRVPDCVSGNTFCHGWGWWVNSCNENRTHMVVTSLAWISTAASPRHRAAQSRQATQISNSASLISPARLKTAATIQRHPQYLQYLQKGAGSWSSKGMPRHPRDGCTVKVNFADGMHQALTVHWDPAAFLDDRHLQPVSFGLIAAKASKSKKAQESHTHTQNKPVCVGKHLMTHSCSSTTAQQVLQAPFGGTRALTSLQTARSYLTTGKKLH